MGFINEKPSAFSVVAGIGSFVGLLLLGYAGVGVVSSNTPVLRGAIVESTNAEQSTNAELARRLQGYIMGYITTTALPSSFDSSDSSSLGSSFEPSKSIDSLSSGSLPSLDVRVAWDSLLHTTGSVWLAVTFTLVIQSLFGVIYFHYVIKVWFNDDTLVSEDKKAVLANKGSNQFDNKILDCLGGNRWVTLTGLCCPMVRQAHTNQVSGVCGFWESLCCWCCCSWVSLGLGPSCLVVLWRTSIQSTMFPLASPGDNMVEDFCITCLCPSLSVCQMAKSVDDAMDSRQIGCVSFEQAGYNASGSYNP